VACSGCHPPSHRLSLWIESSDRRSRSPIRSGPRRPMADQAPLIAAGSTSARRRQPRGASRIDHAQTGGGFLVALFPVDPDGPAAGLDRGSGGIRTPDLSFTAVRPRSPRWSRGPAHRSYTSTAASNCNHECNRQAPTRPRRPRPRSRSRPRRSPPGWRDREHRLRPPPRVRDGGCQHHQQQRRALLARPTWSGGAAGRSGSGLVRTKPLGRRLSSGEL
jgi:hypothetical protein